MSISSRVCLSISWYFSFCRWFSSNVLRCSVVSLIAEMGGFLCVVQIFFFRYPFGWEGSLQGLCHQAEVYKCRLPFREHMSRPDIANLMALLDNAAFLCVCPLPYHLWKFRFPWASILIFFNIQTHTRIPPQTDQALPVATSQAVTQSLHIHLKRKRA